MTDAKDSRGLPLPISFRVLPREFFSLEMQRPCVFVSMSYYVFSLLVQLIIVITTKRARTRWSDRSRNARWGPEKEPLERPELDRVTPVSLSFARHHFMFVFALLLAVRFHILQVFTPLDCASRPRCERSEPISCEQGVQGIEKRASQIWLPTTKPNSGSKRPRTRCPPWVENQMGNRGIK